MRGTRYFTDVIIFAAVAILLSTFLSYALNSSLSRLLNPPTDLVALASRQVSQAIFAAGVAAGLAAFVSSRQTRGPARDLLTLSTRSTSAVVGMTTAIAAPVLAAWTIFWMVTSVASGVHGGAGFSVGIFGVSLLAVLSCVALGQFIGSTLRPAFAVPAAFASAYAFAAVCATFGDDYWWQWLGPAFGDSLSPRPKITWLIGSAAWFAGLTLGLLTLQLVTAIRVKTVPALLHIAAGALISIGVILLAVNGPDASIRVAT